jgi:hypothetical protein
MAMLPWMMAAVLAAAAQGAVKVWQFPPDPKAHPLYPQNYVKGTDYSTFTPIKGRRLPGWAAVRVSNADLDDMPKTWQKIEKYFGADAGKGEFDCANACLAHGEVLFHPNLTDFAKQLKAKHIPISGFGGFCPSGGNQYDIHNDDLGGAIGLYGPGKSYHGVGVKSYIEEARDILNAPGTDAMFAGVEIGEQDARYAYEYALQGVLAAGSGSYFEQYKRFRDFSDTIEYNSGGQMASLQQSPWASHYYHKTGLYYNGGGETQYRGPVVVPCHPLICASLCLPS